jgi:hypothetical protein
MAYLQSDFQLFLASQQAGNQCVYPACEKAYSYFAANHSAAPVFLGRGGCLLPA